MLILWSHNNTVRPFADAFYTSLVHFLGAVTLIVLQRQLLAHPHPASFNPEIILESGSLWTDLCDGEFDDLKASVDEDQQLNT